MSDSAKLIVGAVLLLALVFITNLIKHEAIEAELSGVAAATLADANVEWASVSVDGRNATVSGVAPSQDAGDAAVELVGGQFGIHSAKGDFSVVEVVSPFLWSARFSGTDLILAGVVPSSEVLDAIMARAQSLFSSSTIRNEMRVAGGVPDGDWQSASFQGLQQLARLKSGSARLLGPLLTITGITDTAETASSIKESVTGLATGFKGTTDITVDVPDKAPELPGPIVENTDKAIIVPAEAQKEIDRCQGAIDAIMQGQTINFRTGSAEVIPQPNPLIVRLATVAKECPTTRIVISGHTDSVGDADANQALSKARAQAVVNLLVDESVEAQRLDARGFGSSKPIAENTTPEGRSANRRIEFRVLYAGAP
ncbi:MAG: OmpA family protein [Pseudomonadota bacterium]